MYFLYIIANKITNKIYIGQTKYPEKRWKQHKHLANKKIKHQHIHRAMNKYGIDNFTYEIIAQSINQEDADFAEIELIKQYDSRNPEIGYNFSAGGHVSERSVETRKKLVKNLKEEYLQEKALSYQKSKRIICLLLLKN